MAAAGAAPRRGGALPHPLIRSRRDGDGDLAAHLAGDEVAQGFLHVTTGIVLFAAALGLTILLDKVLRSFIHERRNGAEVSNA